MEKRYIIKTTGDVVHAGFETAINGIATLVTAQQALYAQYGMRSNLICMCAHGSANRRGEAVPTAQHHPSAEDEKVIRMSWCWAARDQALVSQPLIGCHE
jgi:hypothetical protein